jgi:hypothetical protein
VKVYTPGWNMHVGNESLVSSGHKKDPGENPSGCSVQFSCNLSLV